jgi:hypothetical protein
MMVPGLGCEIGRWIAPLLCVKFTTFFQGAAMDWMRRFIVMPASETQMGLVLALCIFTMSLMSLALVWQAQVIAKQNAVIHMMQGRIGG